MDPHAPQKRITIALLASTQDAASMNVYGQLIARWQKTGTTFESAPIYVQQSLHLSAYLFVTAKRSVHCEHIDDSLAAAIGTRPDALIFITKHDSKSGRPSFSVHTQGNWTAADLGGIPREVAITPVVLKHELYRELQRQNDVPGFEVVNECTHHGPSLQTPSAFIEIGSVLEHWQNPACGAVLARALETVLARYRGEIPADQRPIVLGVGGTHTCSNFARLVNEDRIYLSHVCPEYALDGLQAETIQHAQLRSTLSPIIILDWKGMNSAQRQAIIAGLSRLGIAYQTLADLKKSCDAPARTRHEPDPT